MGEFVSIDRSLVENLLSALDRGRVSADQGNLAGSIREIEIAIRSIRRSYFPRTYFSDGLWDILLELHNAQPGTGPIAITNIGLEVGIPLATALRYIKRLEEDGYVLREPDPQDKRRFFISLTKAGRALMNDIFEETSRAFESKGRGTGRTGIQGENVPLGAL
jgi:DNA-binding MarR family transcriptional regulator